MDDEVSAVGRCVYCQAILPIPSLVVRKLEPAPGEKRIDIYLCMRCDSGETAEALHRKMGSSPFEKRN